MATLVSREIAGNSTAVSLFRQSDDNGGDLSVALTNLTVSGANAFAELLIAEASVAKLKAPLVTNKGSGYVTLPKVRLGSSMGPDKLLAPVMEVDTLVCDGPGIYYAVNDVLTLPAGDGTAATIRVLSVNSSGRIISFALVARGAYTSLAFGQDVIQAVGGSGRNAVFRLTHRVVSITLVGEPDLGHEDLVVVIDGNARATVDVTYAVEPRHRFVRKELAPDELFIVKDLPLGKGETILIKASGGALAARVMS